MIIDNAIDAKFFWFNQPKFSVKKDALSITTSADTDFWQRTHYGFQHDNAHCLLTQINFDFSMTVRTEYFPKNQYDQCGLIVRLDSDNWIKTSTEFETEKHSRLGSVVTNLGYSDWATIDVHAFVTHMEYRIQSQHHLQDFLIEYSENGQQWNQLRITHLHKKIETLDVGVYACSPMNGSFEVCFDSFALEQSHWQEY